MLAITLLALANIALCGLALVTIIYDMAPWVRDFTVFGAGWTTGLHYVARQLAKDTPPR